MPLAHKLSEPAEIPTCEQKAVQSLIDPAIIERCELVRDPFDFFAAENVLNPGALEAIRRDFPNITKPGIYPVTSLTFGPAFARLIEEVKSPQFRKIMEKKFSVDLTGMPLMITVRGMAQKKDGRIHADSKDKVVTCLLYLNEKWDAAGGRLRMLRSPDNINNYAAEIPATGGAFAAFRVAPSAWHGHQPFVGERRYIMFNWIRSQEAFRRHEKRHRFSALMKKLLPFFYKGY